MSLPGRPKGERRSAKHGACLMNKAAGDWFGDTLEVQCPACGNRSGATEWLPRQAGIQPRRWRKATLQHQTARSHCHSGLDIPQAVDS